jgi:hypothetical protein
MEEKRVVDVQEWDLGGYPDRDVRTKRAGSDFYKLSFLNYNGNVEIKRVPVMVKENGVMVEREDSGGPRTWAVTGGGSHGTKNIQFVSEIYPADIRRAEEEIGGKPSIVLMGLWYHPEYSVEGKIVKWVGVDRRKASVPPYFRDVTNEYYEIWRPKAYGESYPDPYVDQKRPITRFQEMNSELVKVRAVNEKLVREKDELVRRFHSSTSEKLS